jgi:hypothetical protein
MSIRFKNMRTGREVAAKDGRDLAAMVKIEQDRRSGIEAVEIQRLERVIEAPQKRRIHRQAVAS